MKLYTSLTNLVLLLISTTSMANDCANAFVESWNLQKQLIASSEKVTKDYASSSVLLLQQLEELTKDLSAAKRYSKLSKYMKNNCSNDKDRSYIGDKNIAYAEVLSFQGASTFYENYITPSKTWDEAWDSLTNDILSKREEVKLSIRSSIAKEEASEGERKEALILELEELNKLRALVNKSKKLESENVKLAATIDRTKIEIRDNKKDNKTNPEQPPHPKSKNLVKSNAYKEGQSSFYLKNDSVFCLSERQFDLQIDLLTQGITKAAEHCYLSAYDVDIVMINYGMSSKTKVRSIVDGTTMWVTTESIGRR